MTYPYSKNYLADAQKNLGFFFEFALCNLQLLPEFVQQAFLNSEVPNQIEIGNPNFLCGKSGIELAEIAFANEHLKNYFDKTQFYASQDFFYPAAEYWCGFVLAYCQWKNNLPFKKILDKFPLSKILDSYHLFHEADISKIDSVIMEKCNFQSYL